MDYTPLTNSVDDLTTRKDILGAMNAYGRALGKRLKTIEGVNPHVVVNKFQVSVKAGIGAPTWNKGLSRGARKPAGTTTSRAAAIGKRGVRKPAARTTTAGRSRARSR